MELKAGIKNTNDWVVTEDMTAASAGSGGQRVFSTPHMIALMETTAWASVEPCMEEGCSTVGTHLDVSHLSASPVGAHVHCETELTEVDGRRLVFKVSASDDAGPIGEGTHERFIVKIEKFMARTEAKLEK
ncbi:MAG: thioesterase family protein [Mogibacterium sp.]|nr:thioesterase family protein [Mogibacterium sp.]